MTFECLALKANFKNKQCSDSGSLVVELVLSLTKGESYHLRVTSTTKFTNRDAGWQLRKTTHIFHCVCCFYTKGFHRLATSRDVLHKHRNQLIFLKGEMSVTCCCTQGFSSFFVLRPHFKKGFSMLPH